VALLADSPRGNELLTRRLTTAVSGRCLVPLR
jgi:hypothetical protein